MSHAFTLIEILIVVMILAILAGVALPMFTNMTDDARDAARDIDLRAIREALEAYRARAGSFPQNLAALEGTAVLTGPDGLPAVYGPWFEDLSVDPTDGLDYVYTRNSRYSFTLEGVTYGG
jgi:type II secretion system protein G